MEKAKATQTDPPPSSEPPAYRKPKHPIALRPEYIAPNNTTIHVKQHSASWSSGDFTVTSVPGPENPDPDPKPKELFKVLGELASFSQRRYFRDADGLPLFELSREKMGYKWFLHLPGEKERNKDGKKGSSLFSSSSSSPSSSTSSSKAIATIRSSYSTLKDKFEVSFRNAAVKNEEVTLEVRGQNVWKSLTHVYYHGKLVMEITLKGMAAVYIPGKGPRWDVRVVEGVDLALAAVITVIIAATLYDSNSGLSNTGAPSSVSG
ncbi:tubby C-terminal-like domain-containing protein [Aspergillus stella-maris]|uniref:tubby C-terminal-like domain-containing protein n=1 Tax=Aspergillus stella-maris TaxID=1810926 RepID=UPI003CCDD5DC